MVVLLLHMAFCSTQRNASFFFLSFPDHFLWHLRIVRAPYLYAIAGAVQIKGENSKAEKRLVKAKTFCVARKRLIPIPKSFPACDTVSRFLHIPCGRSLQNKRRSRIFDVERVYVAQREVLHLKYHGPKLKINFSLKKLKIKHRLFVSFKLGPATIRASFNSWIVKSEATMQKVVGLCLDQG